MGIQINGQTDTISASDGSLSVSDYQLTGFTNINSTGIITASTFSGNVSGNVTGDLTGTVQTAAQPNITSLGTLSSLNVSGNVSIAGTLTYEDVTNIDSVGLITARSGVVLTGGDITLGTGVTASGATANTFTLSTNGSERVRVDSSGNINVDSGGVYYDAANNRLAVGTAAPTEKLEIQDGSISVGSSSNTNATNVLIAGYGYILSGTKYGKTSIRSTYSNATNAASLEFYVASGGAATAEAARIDSSGRLLVGTSSSSNTLAFAPVLQVEGNSAASSAVSALRTSDDSNPVYIGLAKKRGSSGSVLNGDLVGRLIFMGFDGSSYQEAAHIETQIDGTPGANDMPGRLVFSTTADGASSPTERMRIDNAGRVTTPYQPSWNLRPNSSTSVTTASSSNFVGWSDNTNGSSSKLCHIQGVTLTGSSSGILGATSTGRINFPVTGKYKVWCTIRCENMPGTGNIYLYINGTQLARQHVEAWGSTYGMPYFHGFHSHILNVAQGDYLEIQLSVPSGAIVSGYNDTVNWCGGYLIG